MFGSYAPTRPRRTDYAGSDEKNKDYRRPNYFPGYPEEFLRGWISNLAKLKEDSGFIEDPTLARGHQPEKNNPESTIS